jgi:N-methylhydantoinase B
MGTFAANLDRFKIPPYGLAGGQPGRGGKLTLTRADGSIEALPSKVAGLALQKGDCLQLETSGGGGHGDPIARSADLIQQDHAAGYVTADR